jgi:chromosome segregation ATPase
VVDLEETVKTMEKRLKGKDLEWKIEIDALNGTVTKMQAQYDFSVLSNKSLKDDYDLLQGKLDKTMKTANNQVQDRNETIDKLTSRVGVLQNFYDEAQERIDEAKAKNDKAMIEFKQAQNEAIELLKSENDEKIKELLDAKQGNLA